MAFTLTFKNLSKTFDHVPETCLFPFIRVLGQEIAPEDIKSKAYLEWREKLLMRMADPVNIGAIAFGLKSIWPDLPEEAVKYKLYELPDGRKEIDFRLAMDADEFLQLIQPINQNIKPDSQKVAPSAAAIVSSSPSRAQLEEQRRLIDAQLETVVA
jgi:hypothetical protein